MSTVVYHAGCADGFCAAWLFRYWLPDAEFIPAQYGDEAPSVSGQVYILDFSFPQDVLKAMAAKCESVLVLDHHKTAQADLQHLNDFDGTGRLIVEFDMDRSGGRMAWDYLKGRAGLPLFLAEFLDLNPTGQHWLVKYTEDRDLWRHALPGTKEINAALRSYPFDFDVWDSLAREQQAMERLLGEGEAILRYKQKLVDQHVPYAKLANFCDGKYTVPAVNCSTGDLQSELAGKLAEGADFGAVWVDQGDGKQLWSLRSRKGGVDVSAVAKSYGGGGHAGAAGFRCDAGTICVHERTS